MTSEEVKKIRSCLGITQEELASILGVTKTTVGRYEIGQAKPSGNVEQKLLQLQASLEDPEQRAVLEETLKGAGGPAATAGLLAFTTALVPMAGLVAGGIGLSMLLKGPAGKNLLAALNKFTKQ